MDSDFLRLARRVADMETAVQRRAGEITAWAGSSAPDGWLICDGSAVRRTQFAALFAVIGTTYGSGDGSTTFNLPNLKGRVAVGRNSADASFDGLGETGGEKTHTLTASEVPDLPIKDSAGHSYYSKDGIVQSSTTGMWWRGLAADNGDRGMLADGGGGAHNNLPPYIVLNYMIKT